METNLSNRQKLFRVFSLIALIVVIFTVTVSCSIGKKEPIKIGLVTTLTGPASTAGIRTRNGAILAIEQANSSGGINGRPVDEALRVDTKLIDDGVVAILGHYLSTLTAKVE